MKSNIVSKIAALDTHSKDTSHISAIKSTTQLPCNI